jgi:ElaA protein
VTGINRGKTREIDISTMYDILRLRQDVFVVEQKCPYPDIDGRDLEPTTVQYWIGADRVEAALRLLVDPDGSARIGRVVTRLDARGRGLAAALIRAAIDAAVGDRILIDAQKYLRDWYARFGFVQSGEDFLEDGIPHIPMTLVRSSPDASNPASGTPATPPSAATR